MDSNVKARPNHYEILGLTPAASAAEIAQAFARKMSAFAARPLAAAAQLSIAFETLRDPERRRAYDDSLRPPSAAVPSATVPPYTLRWNRMPFTASALAAPPTRPQPRQEAAAEPKPEPFIAAPEPVSPKAIEPSPEPASRSEERRQEPQPQQWPELFVEQQRVIRRAIESGPAAQREESPIGWNRTAMLVGGVILGVGLLGAVAGWSAGLVEQPQQAEAGMTVALPRAKPITTVAAAEPAPAWTVEQTRPERPRSIPMARIKRPPPEPRSVASEELQTETSQSAQSQSEAAVVEAQPPAVIPASLSLPNPVIARTLGRIGYACGEVASTSPVEGAAPGVFRVTCTSGHTYQATPVRGRYHFRRWGGR
jgi:hypothetical protein